MIKKVLISLNIVIINCIKMPKQVKKLVIQTNQPPSTRNQDYQF